MLSHAETGLGTSVPQNAYKIFFGSLQHSRRIAVTNQTMSENGMRHAALQDEISTLVVERQELRARNASASALERNRRKLARRQRQLAHALIEHHLGREGSAA
jgi:hypothetical protein